MRIRSKKIRRVLLALLLTILLTSPLWSASLEVTWTANTEPDLAGYEVYDNGILVGTIGIMASPLFNITNIGQGSHSVQVDAFDNATPPNYSPKSDAVVIVVNTIPPAKPGPVKLLIKN
jgi:hypothetical protein